MRAVQPLKNTPPPLPRKCTLHFLIFYFVLWPTNAQLFHKLSHSYMFRHYRVILRELVINTLQSDTSISNAAVCNKYTIKMLRRFYARYIRSNLNIIKSLKIKTFLFTTPSWDFTFIVPCIIIIVSKNNQHDDTCGLSFIFSGSRHSFSTCFEL